MAYRPTTVWSVDTETEEKILNVQKLQNNLNLISRETDKLQTQITKSEEKISSTAIELDKSSTNFHNHFLFLGA